MWKLGFRGSKEVNYLVTQVFLATDLAVGRRIGFKPTSV